MDQTNYASGSCPQATKKRTLALPTVHVPRFGFRTADFERSRSGTFKMVFGEWLRLFLAILAVGTTRTVPARWRLYRYRSTRPPRFGPERRKLPDAPFLRPISARANEASR